MLLPNSDLKRQLVFYIVFIAIVFLTMAIEMTFFLKGSRVQGVLSNGMGASPASELVTLIFLKMGLLLFNLLLAIGLVMLLFSKRIMIPLGRIIEGVRAISNGNFAATLPEQSHDELGDLSRHINELGANYQELILLSKSLTEQARLSLKNSSAEKPTEDALRSLDQLDDMLGEFGRNFYKC